jgi:hypothetical protein
MRLDREKFAKVLGMLGSAPEGEQLAAVRRANAMHNDAGLTWAEANDARTCGSFVTEGPARSQASEEDAMKKHAAGPNWTIPDGVKTAEVNGYHMAY